MLFFHLHFPLIQNNEHNRRVIFLHIIEIHLWFITWAPHPKPRENIADGADHDPSDFLETTKPVPSLYESNAPALTTVKIARPLASLRMAKGIDFSGLDLATYQEIHMNNLLLAWQQINHLIIIHSPYLMALATTHSNKYHTSLRNTDT